MANNHNQNPAISAALRASLQETRVLDSDYSFARQDRGATIHDQAVSPRPERPSRAVRQHTFPSVPHVPFLLSHRGDQDQIVYLFNQDPSRTAISPTHRIALDPYQANRWVVDRYDGYGIWEADHWATRLSWESPDEAAAALIEHLRLQIPTE